MVPSSPLPSSTIRRRRRRRRRKRRRAMTGSIACLAGSQTNQDGRSASLTAPNGPAQEKCIKAVLRECKLTPTEVDCFECHGTGTALGDPIGVWSFRKVMSGTPRKEPVVITSSKVNIAHGEGGAVLLDSSNAACRLLGGKPWKPLGR